jgi:hypothetical protein
MTGTVGNHVDSIVAQWRRERPTWTRWRWSVGFSAWRTSLTSRLPAVSLDRVFSRAGSICSRRCGVPARRTSSARPT